MRKPAVKIQEAILADFLPELTRIEGQVSDKGLFYDLILLCLNEVDLELKDCCDLNVADLRVRAKFRKLIDDVKT